MRRCTECKSEDLRAGDVPVTLTLPMRAADGNAGERIFEGTVRGVTCGSCGAMAYDGPDLGRFERLVALELLRRGMSTGPEIRFLRKQAGLKATDLATHLEVTQQTVADWETGKTLPDVSTLAMVVQLARAELERDEATRKLLEPALAPKDLLARMRARATPGIVQVRSTSVLAA